METSNMALSNESTASKSSRAGGNGGNDCAASWKAEEAIAGNSEALQALRELICYPILYPHESKILGLKWPRGLLLYGPPGTGKTSLVRAVVRECDAHLSAISSYVLGDGAARFFFEFLDNCTLCPSLPDHIVWSGEPSVRFMTRSFTAEVLRRRAPTSAVWRNLWIPTVPAKVGNLLWSFLRDRLPIRWSLLRLGVIQADDAVCPLCSLELESSTHLFMHCPLVRDLWTQVAGLRGSLFVMPGTASAFLQCWEGRDKGSTAFVWGFLLRSMLWRIWKHRNGVVFQHEEFRGDACVREALFDVASWLTVENSSFSHSDLFLDPFRFSLSVQTSTSSVRRAVLCMATTRDRLKFNTDGSFTPPLSGGIRGVLRDADGITLLRFAKPIACSSAVEAEVVAVFLGLFVIHELFLGYLLEVTFELDCRNVVSWINSPGSGLWRFNAMWIAIEKMKFKCLGWDVVHVLHEGTPLPTRWQA